MKCKIFSGSTFYTFFGGSLHRGSLLNGYRDHPYPTENKDPSCRRIKTCDVIIDQPMNMGKSRRLKKIEQTKRDSKTKDEWIWKDEATLVRVHKEPRRKMFIPKEASYLPCDLRRFRDERETLQVFQSNERKIVDSWRLAGNNIERTNRRNEFWTGQTVFKIIPNADLSNVLDGESDRLLIQLSVAPPKNGSSLSHRMICSSVTTEACKARNSWLGCSTDPTSEEWQETIVPLQRSYGDLAGSLLSDIVCELELFEMKDNIPCLVLLCAEERSLITKVHRRDKFKLMNVVTTTEDDNLISPYGRAKWRRCIRSSCDCAFFAGPSTGGSSWNRLNKHVREATAHQIGMKAFLSWELWEEFSNCWLKVMRRMQWHRWNSQEDVIIGEMTGWYDQRD